LHFVCVTRQHVATVMGGNDAVTGHIISTTIGGKNGEPKRVGFGERNSLDCAELHDEGDTTLTYYLVICVL
jgi:hypothetical protein